MTWVLIATDGSAGSNAAVRLATSIAWPQEMQFGVVSVVPPLADLIGAPWAPVMPSNTDELEAGELRRAEEATRSAADQLRAAGLSAKCSVFRGRPANVIVRLASRYPADLIVMGSRGLGTMQAALLGSVSAEVIDKAPCPVLIARSEALGEPVIADDGSAEAEAARAYVLARPYLLGTAAHLLGVSPVHTFWPDTVAPLDPRSVELLVESQIAVRRGLVERLRRDAAELAAAGVPATSEVRDGSAVDEIVAAARELGAGLVVVGTHGRRGLVRLALGSVSRALVHHAPCSVLVVPHGAAREEALDEPQRVGDPVSV